MTLVTAHPLEQCIVAPEGEHPELIAPLVDDVRQWIVDAWDEGRDPRHLLVGDTTYAALRRAKASELGRDQPLFLLGLLVQRQRS